MATRSVVMVKDVNGLVYNLRRTRPPLAMVTYGEEDNRSLGNALAAELKSRGFSVTTFKLWPASGPASYDSAASAITQGSVALFAISDRPTDRRGNLGLPDSVTSLLFATARARPTILVSLGNPYLISDLPEVGSYLIGWRANPVTEEAAARALAGAAPITGHLPITIPPSYPRGWGLQRRGP